MADFSQPPLKVLEESLRKGYIGAHIEQGVPILDRDLNLMHDLVSAVARAITTRYIGSGIAADQDGFEIVEVPGDNNDLRVNNFRILAGPSGQSGTCLVNGIEVTIDQPVNYNKQSISDPDLKVLALTTPDATQPDPRTDVVFLDVWLSYLEGHDNGHEQLRNPDDIGIQTSVRLRPMWAVRVKEAAILVGQDPIWKDPPAPQPGHAYYPLARLDRPRDEKQITTKMITKDLRQRRLTLTDLERRVQQIERLRTLPTFREGTQFDQRVGSPGTTVQLFGRNFDLGGLSVTFGGKEALVGDPSPMGVTAVVPEGLPLGGVRIKVITQWGEANSDSIFTILGPKPQIKGFTPRRGKPETVVEITGDHFDENVSGETTVTFGDEPARIESKDNTKIVTKVPIISVGNYAITVFTEWGKNSPFPTPFEVV